MLGTIAILQYLATLFDEGVDCSTMPDDIDGELGRPLPSGHWQRRWGRCNHKRCEIPLGVSRRVHVRRPRWSKNGTPEERAAKGSPAPTAVAAADPIYAAIERHKAAGVAWDAALLEDDEADAEPLNQAGMELISTVPTTLAGIVAAGQYIRAQMSDDGTYMPHTLIPDTGGDNQETMG
jgi:hypothetical protein